MGLVLVENCALDHRIWGKEKGLASPGNPHAYYPLVCHLVDTAAIAQALFDALFTDKTRLRLAAEAGVSVAELRCLVGFWAGLHDIGKISPPFQGKVGRLADVLDRDPAYRVGANARRDDLHHSQASHWILVEVLAALGYPQTAQARTDVGHQIAQLLGGHHGRFWDALNAAERRAPRAERAGLGDGAWASQSHAHARVLRTLTGAHAVPPGPLPVAPTVVLAALVMVADWLASQDDFIRERIPYLGWTASDDEVSAHWERAVADAPALVVRAGLGRAEFHEMAFEEQFEFEPGRPVTPNPLQRSLIDDLPDLVTGPGLLLVTAPPGEGKTEAALYASRILARASGARGMVFALPTMATTDAMHARVAKYAGRTLLGPTPLTKVHSTAWLSTPDPGETAADGDPDAGADVALTSGSAHEPTQWLLGARRGLLAPLSVVTIDQLLTGVLPVRYNVMRLFGASDKVVVIDEAHAYGAWMNELLLRLVEWLGAFRTPVILLSATLAGPAARAMVEAYRRGCGHKPSKTEEWSPVYPGWTYVDAGTGSVSEPRSVRSERTRTLRFEVVPVQRPDKKSEGDPKHRLSFVIRRLLAPVVDQGGNVLVCCTTVAEAQATHEDLRTWLSTLPADRERPELRLLHSRFRMKDRARITERVETAFGKAGPRPTSAIVVATQIVEQSLDLDFDLIISNLAPAAQLLQRSGRCRRHEHGSSKGKDLHAKFRPPWLHEDPTMVVLDPVGEDGTFALPKAWGEKIYDASLLQGTRDELSARPAIAVPEDVQRVIDNVYTDAFLLDPATPPGTSPASDAATRKAAERRRATREAAERELANMVAVKRPYEPRHDLQQRFSPGTGLVDEALITTRLGADSGQLVCVYEQGDDLWSLDEAGEVPVPGWGSARPLTRAQQEKIAAFMIPTPGSWLADGADLAELPRSWQRSAIARYWLVLPMRRTAHGTWRGVLARGRVAYDDERGLREVEE
ncbi:CRISPR-associated helicase Cas3' [Embleya sp. NPDC056575]|uniref:CRISPR-associated helicase Cas3' n=1 Tax=unclassified Embleya TaxID=2699296 RepID=UPI0036CB54CC